MHYGKTAQIRDFWTFWPVIHAKSAYLDSQLYANFCEKVWMYNCRAYHFAGGGGI